MISGNCSSTGVGIGINDGVGEDGATSSGDGVATAVGVGELGNDPTFATVVRSAGAGFRNRNAPAEASKITVNRIKLHRTNSAGGMFFMRLISAFIRFPKS